VNNSIEVDEMTRVSSSWPLISYLFDVAEYEEIYKGYLREFIDEVFIVDQMQSLYTEYYNLLQQYAYDEVSGYTFISPDSEFDSAVSVLKTHVQSRNSVVNKYLD
ncbi:MAG: CotH kinase family protein, partial [Rikenellaceae bacterium]